jgi:ankyrin repeat protein
MNLSKATRECKNLQREMREVRNEDGRTQLWYFCRNGMTSSVVRMLAMRSIDVEGRYGGRDDGWTCLMTAAAYGHLDICGLLVDKGAQLEARGSGGWTPLHFAANEGLVEIVRLLCDRGAYVEAQDDDGERPIHFAARWGYISVVKELIEERNVEINSRDYNGGTALWMAHIHDRADVAAYLVSHGAIYDDDEEEEEGADNNDVNDDD